MKLSYIPFLLLFLIGCKENDPPLVQLTLNQLRIGTTDINFDGTSENIAIDRNIELTFSQPINPSSAEEGIELKDGDEVVQINFNFLTDNKIVTLSPVGTLKNNSSYTLTCSELLQGENGQSFNPVTIAFKTAIGVLELVGVQAGGKDINLTGRISDIPLALDLSFSFSDPVDPETFASAFSILGEENAEFTFTYENDHRIANVNAVESLASLSQYDLTLGNTLKGAEGEAFQGFDLSFYTSIDSTLKFPEITIEALLTKVQRQTFNYFWEFAHPTSGMIRERNTSGDLVTIGGTGFGLMALIVGVERGFITRQEAVERWGTIINFLENADRFHGVWPHWMNGETGKTIPFSANDDGADLVETALLTQGLLTVRQYLNPSVNNENEIIEKINSLWQSIEWSWFRQDDQDQLFWHWSPNFGWEKNLSITGWNEALIVYVLAASSTDYPISKATYEEGWARSGAMANGNAYYNVNLPLGPPRGGPLFFAHYSFLGLDPRELSDQYANYWEQNVNHTRINQNHCVANPNNFVGYGASAWGLTASDTFGGYTAHSPNNDLGTITPTAALSSMPFHPEGAIAAMEHFYYLMGDRLWGPYGFYDAYNVTENWYADSYLAIDQGPIIIMIENYRTGLFWQLFMSAPEVGEGLTKLGFTF